MSENAITVRSRRIPYEIQEIGIYSLRFYAENPRINYIISTQKGEVTQEDIEKRLQALDATKDLVRDIEENDGLLEEVIVIGDQVVEGNTRLAAYRRLAKKYPAETRWKKIRAKVLIGDVEAKELFYILGTFHLKGKTEWSAYEKAAYIYRMVRQLDSSAADVARQFNHQRATVEAMISAYEAMRDLYLPNLGGAEDEFALQDELHKYSYFEAFYRTRDLAERAQQTPAFVEEFAEWVGKEVFPTAQSVRELPNILRTKKARKTFNELVETEPEAAFDEAQAVVKERKPELTETFYKKVKEFHDILNQKSLDEIREDMEADSPRSNQCRYHLQTCFKTFKNFCKNVGIDV